MSLFGCCSSTQNPIKRSGCPWEESKKKLALESSLVAFASITIEMKCLFTAFLAFLPTTRGVSANAESSSCVLLEDDTSIPRVDGSTLAAVASGENTTMASDAITREATRLLQTYGAVVIENLVLPNVMEQLNEDLAQQQGQFFGSKNSFAGSQTTRNAAKCLGESKIAQDLATNPVTVDVVNNVLKPYTKRVILGTNSAITVVGPTSPDDPPAPAQTIHRDDSMWAGDWMTTLACTNPYLTEEKDRFPQLSVSVMWAASDFTADNGATRAALYSHKQCPRTSQPPPDIKYAQAVMSQGSVMLWLGGTFHGAAAAKSYEERRSPRRGLIFIYNVRVLEYSSFRIPVRPFLCFISPFIFAVRNAPE